MQVHQALQACNREETWAAGKCPASLGRKRPLAMSMEHSASSKQSSVSQANISHSHCGRALGQMDYLTFRSQTCKSLEFQAPWPICSDHQDTFPVSKCQPCRRVKKSGCLGTTGLTELSLTLPRFTPVLSEQIRIFLLYEKKQGGWRVPNPQAVRFRQLHVAHPKDKIEDLKFSETCPRSCYQGPEPWAASTSTETNWETETCGQDRVIQSMLERMA